MHCFMGTLHCCPSHYLKLNELITKSYIRSIVHKKSFMHLPALVFSVVSSYNRSKSTIPLDTSYEQQVRTSNATLKHHHCFRNRLTFITFISLFLTNQIWCYLFYLQVLRFYLSSYIECTTEFVL